MVYDWIISNKEFLKIIYSIIIIIICSIIVIKTDRLFSLSFHQGIRYFRNAFFFFGIAFIFRTIIGLDSFAFFLNINNFFIIKAAFEFFTIMAGFFLLYSLIWKKFEPFHHPHSSIFNPRINLFYLMTVILIFLDYIWKTYFFMFFSQIILFFFALIISFLNFKEGGDKHKFLKFYMIAMLLSFLAWILNAIAASYLNWNQLVIIDIYFINMIIFLLFLYGVIKFTKN